VGEYTAVAARCPYASPAIKRRVAPASRISGSVRAALVLERRGGLFPLCGNATQVWNAVDRRRRPPPAASGGVRSEGTMPAPATIPVHVAGRINSAVPGCRGA